MAKEYLDKSGATLLWTKMKDYAETVGDKTYVHNQETPSATWEVTHNLGKNPAITVVDSAGTVVEGQYSYIDENNVVLDFSGAFAGKAYFN